MQRITITLPDEFCDSLDRYMKARGYTNRSEACRDLMRAGLVEEGHNIAPETQALAALAYIFDHETRNLAKRLTEQHHAHHDISVCSTHVHLDHDSCMEVSILRGPAADILHHADMVLTQRGVQHGRLFMIPASEIVERYVQSDHGLDHENHSIQRSILNTDGRDQS